MKSSAAWKATGVVLLVLLVGTGLYFSFVHPYYSRLIQLRFGDLLHPAPADLASATYLLTPKNGGGLYHAGKLEYQDFDRDGSIVTEYAPEGSAVAKLILRQATNMIDVAVDGTTLFSSPFAKRSLDLSPSGAKVAFVSCDAETKTQNKGSMLGCWQASVIDVATKERKALGSAVAVTFLDEGTVMILNDTGAFSVDLSTGARVSLLSEHPPFVSGANLVHSPDRSTIAWAEVIPGIFDAARVYSVSKNGAEYGLESIASMRDITGTILLTPEHVYELRNVGGRTELVQHPLGATDASSVVRTYPSVLSLSNIILTP